MTDSRSQLGLIGNPENRRIVDFGKACRELGRPVPECLSYEQLLSEPACLNRFQAELIRIDSPGENERVARDLIALGGGPQNCSFEFGEIVYLKEYHRGFCELMKRLKEAPFRYLNCPHELALMFDKWTCHQLFVDNGVARPPARLTASSYGEFKENLGACGRLFLKPLHGSSASGVCALAWNRTRMSLVAPLRIQNGTLVNSLRVQRYEKEAQIATILDHLLPQGMLAEQWIPKLSLPGGVIDLRVLVLDGAARHRVVRQSQHPMTNLHLGNRRGDADQLAEYLGPARWRAALELAEQAAACFPNCLSAGVDILLDTSGRPWVAEINAFGDLLPGLYHRGESAYGALCSLVA